MRLFSFRQGLLITGQPGTGKTTLLKFLVENLIQNFPKIKFIGFITEEVRVSDQRIGFDLKPIGETAKKSPISLPLARKSKRRSKKSLPMVGSYEVYLANLEKLLYFLWEELKEDGCMKVLVLDEIGKMEVKSSKFCQFWEEVLARKVSFLATCGMGNHPFLKSMRELEGLLYCEVNLENRDFLRERLLIEFNRPGRLFVLEGIDGAGKTTLHHLLKEIFKEHKPLGRPFLFSQEPTQSSFGQRIRTALAKGDLSTQELLNLFLQDRYWHVKEVILPALKEGQTVILDRYYLSTVAYQGLSEEFSLPQLLRLNENFAPTPDLVIYLDLSPEEALRRIKKRAEDLSFFEKKELLNKIYQNYQWLLRFFPLVRISAQQDPEEIAKEVQKLIWKEVSRV